MRYARLLSWLLFVLFFLIYLTAIKIVRGNQWPARQYFIHEVAPLYTFQNPYQTNLRLQQAPLQSHQQSAITSSSQQKVDQQLANTIVDLTAKEARELGTNQQQHVSFGAERSQQHQTITRRHQLPLSPQQSSPNVLQNHFPPNKHSQPSVTTGSVGSNVVAPCEYG